MLGKSEVRKRTDENVGENLGHIHGDWQVRLRITLHMEIHCLPELLKEAKPQLWFPEDADLSAMGEAGGKNTESSQTALVVNTVYWDRNDGFRVGMHNLIHSREKHREDQGNIRMAVGTRDQ